MASYGYGNNDRVWKGSKKGILAKALEGLIYDMYGEGKFIGLSRGQRPCILADELSEGSR